MILYDGPSMFDGKPILAIATGLAAPSSNRKTGPMIQVWILPKNGKPTDSIKSGADESVCGDCPARGMWCYVNVGQAPNQIYRTWQRGGYQPSSIPLLTGRAIRLGAWGDPAALPFDICKEIVEASCLHTGYTHAWRYCDQQYAEILMASCDTAEEGYQARAMGWRTFRVKQEDEERFQWEASCPASKENSKIQCIDCGACNGNWRGYNGNVVINAHGSTASRYQEFITQNSPPMAA